MRLDVIEGWVSPAAARETYGVVLEGDPSDEAVEVEVEATARLRTELRTARMAA